MKRTQVLLTEEQHKILKNISSEKNISMAAVVRECVTHYTAVLTSKPMTGEDEKIKKALNVAGRFVAGDSNISVNHDDYLKEYFKK